MARGSGVHSAFVHGRKQHLLSDLTGTLVEIGSGTGVNLEFLPEGVRIIGVDPNPFMHAHFRREARARRRPAHLVRGVAESLPFPDESVDAVLSTLVLCSVPFLQHTLGEVLRVLKPGGKFLFIEHVAAPEGTWLRRVQRMARPIWSRIGDGCQPDRTTGEALLEAGFSNVTLDRFSVPLLLVSPHISGSAEK
ncbi:MAG: class I SAM-dependent methyltransferase [Gemmatimonadota bacterium]|jgi:ubiquinone/menaquinone biosynthesis C-methylase UbiE